MRCPSCSRGSEAALLLGVYYPHLVHAVAAVVPSSVALCSYPLCDGPAWTLHGKPVPYTRQLRTVDDQAQLRVQVERALIEIHRPDEQPLPIEYKCLGMQGEMAGHSRLDYASAAARLT